MGGGSDSAKQRESQNAAAQLALAQQNAALQKQIYGQISPYATGLLNAGQNALQGIAPSYFTNAVAPNLEAGFQGARQNLMNFFGRSGQGISGIAAGPLANEQNDEAMGMANLQNQAIMQALNMGGQGANMLAGQQSIFNPSPYFQGTSAADQNIFAMSQNPLMGLLGGVLAAAGPMWMAKGKSSTANFGGSSEGIPTSAGGSSSGGGVGGSGYDYGL